MKRVLLVAATTGYQTRSFEDAAGQLGIELMYATDCCHLIADPWRDQAVPVRFHEPDDSIAAVIAAASARTLDGVLAVGDRSTVIAAGVAHDLGIPWHSAEAARATCNKLHARECLAKAGQPGPWFRVAPLSADPSMLAASISYPCVLKPLAMSGSRGVIRADSRREFENAFLRLCRLLRSRDVRARRDPADDSILVEGYVPGDEFALEAVLDRGRLRVLALFDKPDPLEGPFFEETIYVTPSRLAEPLQRAIADEIDRVAAAMGLSHGPIHAECRVGKAGVSVLEVAARPIGGLCARALRFLGPKAGSASLEELLLRHAVGEKIDAWRREGLASGVMMIPIPRRGLYRGVRGLEAASLVPGVEEIRITAKPDQVLVPLPEGSSYLGFIFARGESAEDAEGALRSAHRHLDFAIEPALQLASPLR